MYDALSGRARTRIFGPFSIGKLTAKAGGIDEYYFVGFAFERMRESEFWPSFSINERFKLHATASESSE